MCTRIIFIIILIMSRRSKFVVHAISLLMTVYFIFIFWYVTKEYLDNTLGGKGEEENVDHVTPLDYFTQIFTEEYDANDYDDDDQDRNNDKVFDYSEQQEDDEENNGRNETIEFVRINGKAQRLF